MEELKNQLAHKEEKITKQITVECNVSVDDELEKVLSVTANVSSVSVELFDKEAKLNGEILMSVLYKTTDDQINTVSSSCNFDDVLKNDNILAEHKSFVNAKILSVSPSSLDNNNVKFVVVLEVELENTCNKDVEIYNSNDESICLKTDEMQVTKLCGINCAQFNVESNSTLNENIKKVLCVDSNVVVNETTAGEGYVVINGTVCTYLVVLTEENKFKSHQICNEFKQEIEFAEMTSDCLNEVCVSVKKQDIKVTLEEGAQLSLNIVVPVKACVKQYKQQTIDVVSDVYGTKFELELEKKQFDNVNFYKPKYFESKIEGNLVLSENEPRIDKVLANSAPTLKVTNSYFADGNVYIEGIINTNVIYLNDEDEQIYSVEMEVPFKVSEKTSLEQENVNVNVISMVSDCDCMAKRGREIFFDCKLKTYAQFSSVCNYEVLSSVKQGRVYPQNESAIEIYFAKKGNTVWDIAKELKITEETLLTQNPDLMSPLENDEKVIVYYGSV